MPRTSSLECCNQEECSKGSRRNSHDGSSMRRDGSTGRKNKTSPHTKQGFKYLQSRFVFLPTHNSKALVMLEPIGASKNRHVHFADLFRFPVQIGERSRTRKTHRRSQRGADTDWPMSGRHDHPLHPISHYRCPTQDLGMLVKARPVHLWIDQGARILTEPRRTIETKSKR